MKEMMITDRLATLQASPVFNELEESELLLIAEVSRLRVYAPGAVICRPEDVTIRFYLPFEGNTEFADGRSTPAVFDLPSLVFDQPLSQTIRAGRHGASCLTIEKGHFFTLMAECPTILVNIMRLGLRGGAASKNNESRA